jgi:DNA-binding transcriptional LysR family regulator
MELKQLRNFVKIVEEGNITRAAQKLNIAQPPLSTQMHQLETELNCVLFQRGARNIILTDAGSMLYEKAKTILSLSDQIPEEINGIETAASVLHLGIITSVSTYLPDIILPSFVKQHPNFKYNIYEKNTYQLIEAVFSNIIDLAIVRTPFQNTGLTCYPIQKDLMYTVGKKQFFRDVSSEAIEFTDLGNTPLIIYRRWEDILRKHCMSCGIQPQFQCICDDARTTLHWAEAGLGIGIVPESIVSHMTGSDLLAKPITNPALTSEITLIHLKGKSLSIAAKAFVSYIQTGNYRK